MDLIYGDPLILATFISNFQFFALFKLFSGLGQHNLHDQLRLPHGAAFRGALVGVCQ